MAEMTRVEAHPVSPQGWEHKNVMAQADGVDLPAGTVVTITASTPDLYYEFCVDKCSTAQSATEVKKYVVVMDAKADQECQITDDVEMEGWTGLPGLGLPLYPSGTVPGGIADAITVPKPAQMWAMTPTKIKFSFG